MMTWGQFANSISSTSSCSSFVFPRNLNRCIANHLCLWLSEKAMQRWRVSKKKKKSVLVGWYRPHGPHCTYMYAHKGLIKCLHHTVTWDENPHFCATCSLSCFETPQCTRFTLPCTRRAPPRRHPPHSRQFPQWEHFNHDGRNIHPHPLCPLACSLTHTYAHARAHALVVIHSFLTRILWEDKRRASSDP